jgi:WD40 repeat protein
MTLMGDQRAVDRPVDFLVSYEPGDEPWGAWIGWQLEVGGHRALVPAWDLVRGTTVEEFSERGVRSSAVVVAIVSGAGGSRHGPAQIALRADPAKLVIVRVEDCSLEGLPDAATLDLARFTDPHSASAKLLAGVREVLARAADPARSHAESGRPRERERPFGRVPVDTPAFPPRLRAVTARRDGISLLHVAGPRFGRGAADDPGEPLTAQDFLERIRSNVTSLTEAGAPHPQLIVVSGDLTETAKPRQLNEAWTFLTGLRIAFGLDAGRLVIVPGARDVSRPLCEAYFKSCEALDETPTAPYFPKLELYAELFADLYRGLEGPAFDRLQPWTLFDVPELRVAVAAMNSTWGITHRREDQYGQIGRAQANWFTVRLREIEQRGWLRIGVVRHDPLPGMSGSQSQAVLRDADVLERFLGDRLNLLLHGPGPGGTAISRLGPALPVLPAGGLGREEIVHVTADGIARFSEYHGRAGEPTVYPVSGWRGAEATFTRTAPELPPADPVAALGRPNDPCGALLRSVADVCASGHPTARIRAVDEPPQLIVTWQDGGVTHQRRIGAHVGELTDDVVDTFRSHDRNDVAELVYQGGAPTPALRARATRNHVLLRTLTEFKGLLDLDEFVNGQTQRLLADPAYSPDLYVQQRFRELSRADQSVREDLAEELMALVQADQGQFVIVLGDFGRGKSFVLRELTRRIATTSLIPILIDLAALDRSLSVDELVAAHLARHGESVVDLNAFRYMLGEGRIVLLFDGFDELVTRISYENATDHLERLIEASTGKAKIVVACRTQHFRSHDQVFTALGERVGQVPQRRVLTIEEFRANEVRTYLVRRFHGDETKADSRYQLLRNLPDLLALAQNPRMLGFIAALDSERLRAAAHRRDVISAAGLYREIIDAWLAHETRRASGGSGAAPGLDTETLRAAVTTLALRLWDAGESYLQPAQLTEVAESLSSLAAGRLSPQQRLHAVGSGSLLIRTDAGLFGFIHTSVMEWLVASVIADELVAGVASPAPLARRPLTPNGVDFLCDLADGETCRRWADVMSANPDASAAERINADKVRIRLDTPATGDLRGAVLRGEDLSYRDFTQGNLSGADLTDANLVGAVLNGAELVGATLVGARLDHAKLVGADLTDADLTRARLTRTDLRGAVLTGSTWTHAALIDAIGVPDVPELRVAAVAPGAPVETELAPASVGVRHGFHAQMGRLPQVLAYSPDGATLAVGSDDGGVLVCDTATGRPIRTLQGHRGRVFAVDFGADVLVTGSADGTVRIWDAITGRTRHVLEGHAQWPWPVLLSSTGELLATGDEQGVIRLWDVASGALRHEIPAADEFVFSLAIHGTLLAAAYRTGTVRLWDTESGTLVGALPTQPGSIYRLAFDPGGNLLVTAGPNNTLVGWDPATRQRVWQLDGHQGRIYAMAFHPVEPLLVSGDTDGLVRVWDTTSGALRHALDGHRNAIYHVTFSPSGELIASGDSAGVVRLWSTGTGQLRHELTAHTGSVWPFMFRPDGAQLAISDDQFTVRLWDPATGQRGAKFTGHGRVIDTVRFSADGSLLATSGNDGMVRLWHPTTGRQIGRLADPLVNLGGAEFSPAGPVLAIVSTDGRLNMHNLDTDRYDRHIHVEAAPIWAHAFRPGGNILATANDDDTVSIWNRATGRQLHVLTEHRGRVRSIAFSRDGARLVTGCDDSRVRIWDVRSGRLLHTLEGHQHRVYSVAFGPGDLVASASWDRTARLWRPRGGETTVLRRHTGRLWAVAFDPVGQLLATAGDDLVIRLWDPATGDHLQTLTGHRNTVRSLAFNPAGDLLASGSGDGTARLWSVAGGQASKRLTLLGLPDGWAALSPEGTYKVHGDIAEQFWHVIDMCRFESGELDSYLSDPRQLPLDSPF